MESNDEDIFYSDDESSYSELYQVCNQNDWGGLNFEVES